MYINVFYVHVHDLFHDYHQFHVVFHHENFFVVAQIDRYEDNDWIFHDHVEESTTISHLCYVYLIENQQKIFQVTEIREKE
jgi:hypothetical protein